MPHPEPPSQPAIAPATVERRAIVTKVELRANASGVSGPGTIFGYAATFNTMSCDLGGFFETLSPGCFGGCEGDDVRCLMNHDANLVLGRSLAGTLEFAQDAQGLTYQCALPDTQCGRDTATSIARGDITGCSFSFIIAESVPEFRGDVWVNVIKKVARLFDVGPVTFPAYEATSVSMRSLDQFRATRDAAHQLQVASFLSRANARLRLDREILTHITRSSSHAPTH